MANEREPVMQRFERIADIYAGSEEAHTVWITAEEAVNIAAALRAQETSK